MLSGLKRLLGMQPTQSELGAIAAPTHVRVFGRIECANMVASPISGLMAAAFRVEIEHSLSRAERVVLDRTVAPRGDGVLETRPDLWSTSREEADANPLVADLQRSQNRFAIILFVIAFGAVAVGEAGRKLGWW